MSTLMVEFEMPPEILRGLLAGEYNRFGGVIRNDAGEIVRHLVQTSEFLSSENVAIANQLRALNLTGNLAFSTNILTLGIMTAGFLIFNNKLNRIESRLNDICIGLQNIEKKVDFIQDQIAVGFLATLRSAAEMGEIALQSKVQRDFQLVNARNKFVAAKNSFHELIDKLQRRHDIANVYKIYVHYGLCYTIANLGETKCSLYLNDFDVAKRSSEKSKIFLAEMFNNYTEYLNPRRVSVLKIPYNDICNVKSGKRELQEMHDRILTNQIQIDLFKRTETDYIELENKCQIASNKYPLAYIVEVA